MSFLSPITALIAAGVAVPVLICLYFLKMRRPEVTVSSTLLWTKAIDDLQANTLFQKLRRNLLLWLQIFALAMLLIAAARPTIRSSAQADRRMVILLDHSASMNASDVTPTRLERAKGIAVELIEQLDHHTRAAMIVSFANHAQVVQPFTTDRARLRQAVRTIEPTDLPTRLTPALRLVEPLVTQTTASGSRGSLAVYVISDGGIDGAEALQDSPVTGVDLHYLKVGHLRDNVAIVSLAGRRDPQDPKDVHVFTRVANYGTRPVDTNLTLKLDGRIQRAVPVSIPGASSTTQSGTVPLRFSLALPSWALLELNLELNPDDRDYLAADNIAWLTLTPPGGLNVLLVTTGNGFLTRAIQAAGADMLIQVTPEQYEEDPLLTGGGRDSKEAFDVIVFDRYRPQAIPVVHSLYFAGTPPVDRLSLSQTGGQSWQIVLDWKRHHPLMAHVTLDDLVISQANYIAVPDTAEVLATGQWGPIMARITTGHVRHVIVSFDVQRSNWPLQIGFPVFVRNCMQWLGAHGHWQTGMTFRPGQYSVLPISDAPVPRSYEPSTTTKQLHLTSPLPFSRVGLYRTRHDTPHSPWDRLGVSLLNPIESDLQPRGQIATGTSAVYSASGTTVIQREVWRWFAAVALITLIIEWVVYTRRLHL